MIINFSDEKLRFGDLSIDYTDNLQKMVKERILADADLMKQITEEEKEEWPDLEEAKFKSFLDLKVDEIAEEAVAKIRIYCEFDLEVKL